MLRRFDVQVIAVCASVVVFDLSLLTRSPAGETSSQRDTDVAEKVDEIFGQWNQPDSPGCAVGIIRNGELIYSKGFGSANLDHEVPNTPQTIFEIGSFAKSFTCACLALLLDQGKISPDDDIRRYLPELHKFDPPVRIRHLVRCRSGLWAQWHITQLAGWYAQPGEMPYSENDMLALIAGQKKLPFEPGTEFRYGTSDYFLLGMIVKRVTGQSLAQFANSNLFGPLGMTRTFIMEQPTRVVRHRAFGYYEHPDGGWRQWTQTSRAPGGRGLYTCVEDLFHWDGNFYDNRLPKGKYIREFIQKGTLLDNRNVLDARPTGEYRGLKRVQFTGGMPGFAAAMAQFPDQRFTVICLCNNSKIAPWEIASQIADLYLVDQLGPKPPLDEDVANRQRDKAVALDLSDLTDKVGVFRLKDDRRIWKTSLKDGQLYLIDHLNQAYPLRPMSATRFQPIGRPFHKSARLIFWRKSPDEPFSLTDKWVGGSIEFDRVELVEPTQQELSQHVGEYYSDELATIYRIKLEDGKLQLRVNNLGWEPLDATVRDEFVLHRRQAHDNRILTFVRDSKKRTIGMTVALWRVKGVYFTKKQGPSAR